MQTLGLLGPAVQTLALLGPALQTLALLGPAVLTLALLGPAVQTLALLGPAVQTLALLGPAVLTLALLGSAVQTLSLIGHAVQILAFLGPAVQTLALLGPAACSEYTIVHFVKDEDTHGRTDQLPAYSALTPKMTIRIGQAQFCASQQQLSFRSHALGYLKGGKKCTNSGLHLSITTDFSRTSALPSH